MRGWVIAAALALAVVPRAAAADDTLLVVAGFPSGIDVVEHVAENAGLYKAEHLIIDKQYSGGASTCAQLAATGKADVCATAIEPTILGYDKGLRLQIFFSRVYSYLFELVVLDDGPIKTLADFRGQSVGEPNAGSGVEISTDDMLAGAGLKRSDYDYLPVGVGAQALSALVTHKVAALTLTVMDRIAAENVAHLKFRIFRDPILASIPNSGFAASPATIAAKGDELKRYARANVKAALLIRENPQAAARFALMGGRGATGVTSDSLRTETAQLIALQNDLAGANPSNPRIGYMPLNGVTIYNTFFYNAGLTSTIVPASAIVTNQFIAYANDFDKKAWIAEVKAMH
jgi:NitT/TauT family transport system substrate-binding protein